MAAQLGNHGVDAVQLLHVERLGGVFIVDAVTVEQETIRASLSPHAGAVGVHQLLHVGCLLDFELDFISFCIAHLDNKTS